MADARPSYSSCDTVSWDAQYHRRLGMRDYLVSGRGTSRGLVWGMALALTATPLAASAAERIVVVEEFTATW